MEKEEQAVGEVFGPTLEGSSFDMLLKSIACGRNSEHRRFLCKEVLPGLVDVCAHVGLVIN